MHLEDLLKKENDGAEMTFGEKNRLDLGKNVFLKK